MQEDIKSMKEQVIMKECKECRKYPTLCDGMSEEEMHNKYYGLDCWENVWGD